MEGKAICQKPGAKHILGYLDDTSAEAGRHEVLEIALFQLDGIHLRLEGVVEEYKLVYCFPIARVRFNRRVAPFRQSDFDVEVASGLEYLIEVLEFREFPFDFGGDPHARFIRTNQLPMIRIFIEIDFGTDSPRQCRIH